MATPGLSPAPDGLPLEPADEALKQNVALAVVESTLGDLEELANDIDTMSVYAVRADHLSTWAAKIRTAVKAIGSNDAAKRPRAKRSASHDRDAAGSHAAPQPDATEKQDTRHLTIVPTNPATLAPFVSGGVHLLLDALAGLVQADWGTCFVYSAKTEELVLACSVGKRLDRPGTLRLSATSGIESHVLATGIAVNVAHAYAEEEFRPSQDQTSQSRTRSELVFPLLKPGSNAHTFGVIQLCNKLGGTAFFDANDENIVAESAQFIASIIAKFPSDITSTMCFDPAMLITSDAHAEKNALSRAFPLVTETPKRDHAATMVFRTARAGHVKRAEVMRDSAKLPTVPSITEAMQHITKVNDAWRNAVLLNMELEKEISRLHDSLSVAKRESTRLQAVSNELKKQLEAAEGSMEHSTKSRRQSAAPGSAVQPM